MVNYLKKNLPKEMIMKINRNMMVSSTLQKIHSGEELSKKERKEVNSNLESVENKGHNKLPHPFEVSTCHGSCDEGGGFHSN